MSLNPNGRPIRLIGFSGGGSLAVLVAPKLNNVAAIVTINANLDTQAWTEQHQYTPLYGSLNPIDVWPAVNSIPQWHLFGQSDQNVDAKSWRPILSKASHSKVLIYPGYNHRCCWSNIWKFFLDEHFSSH
jgi:dienelactone hydrolase